MLGQASDDDLNAPAPLTIGSADAGRLSLVGRGLVAVPAASLTPDLRSLDLSENCLSKPLLLPPLPVLMELRCVFWHDRGRTGDAHASH